MEDHDIVYKTPKTQTKIVLRTVLVPVTVMVDQVIQGTETAPKIVMEDREIEVPHQVYETVTRTVQRPKTIMEEKVIAVQEPTNCPGSQADPRDPD
ncbi:hypothetical protein GUITHDRAFT_99253 [Guillardia theta CCMP2712]|uniref:Uncharacterized protein n=1 Tax=Guillardia theta (strain CCMP2712) TaxID=905079 RepID=L1K3T5_GUITC|nr:hypothetical protein GUITHDRAFT_99253 [Guillardia theta CCMP2712]EKX55476.1 hypothetical protein GUITHDRAFT_99253 [Guillardia theta CCMP2712]|mmetsp:Transcript_35010/g.109436  ORF Transcript_35010/g.109436 Transcript_35010/m.109436 type:complete len:96 (-) Transcript_35010:121-408(-)|eukprot:XP_005842456.1 hypothetical protein GUITHDRAFT_99253 [Guillardia theta CCMP2712]